MSDITGPRRRRSLPPPAIAGHPAAGTGAHERDPVPGLRVIPGSRSSPAAILQGYLDRLDRSPLSAHTRRAYARHARAFVEWVLERDGEAAELAFSDGFARDFAVRDFRSALKDRRLAPASVNAALTGVDDLYRFVGLGVPQVRREPLAAQAPRALTEEQLRALFRAAQRRGRPRDRAILALLALAGLRISEAAQLDVGDVAVSARKGQVLVRRGKGDIARTVPLGTEARAALEPVLKGREAEPAAPLLVSSSGERLSVRSIDRVVRALGELAGVELSAHVLRHTFVTRLVRSGTDVVLVAELAGHRSLETTRRYALPTEDDRARAVEGAEVGY
jgi:site-specific recombinase XerD